MPNNDGEQVISAFRDHALFKHDVPRSARSLGARAAGVAIAVAAADLDVPWLQFCASMRCLACAQVPGFVYRGHRMNRPVVLLCIVSLALLGVAAVPAPAADRDQSRPWQEFPLEQTPRPNATTPGPTPASNQGDYHEESGSAPLLALLAILALVTAVVSSIAARGNHRAARGRWPEAKAPPAAAAEPSPAMPLARAVAPREPQQRRARTTHRQPPARPEMPPRHPVTGAPTAPARRDAPKAPAAAPLRPVRPPGDMRKPDRPAVRTGPETAYVDECRIRLRKRYPKAQFYAVPPGGETVLAESRYFRFIPGEYPDDLQAAHEAFAALVQELSAVGWVEVGRGAAPWDVHFRRPPRLASGASELAPSARVDHAVERAGGATRRVDAGGLDLAAELEDGQQVRVPERTAHAAGSTTPAAGRAAASAVSKHPINLNTATLEQLRMLSGIGPTTAQKILDLREERGGFSSVEELGEIPGIGDVRLASLREEVTL